MNSKNCQTSKPHVLILKFTDKLDLRRGENRIAWSDSIYYTWKNIKSSCNNNKFKISAPTWNDKLELLHGSYIVSDIQYYFEYIWKKHGENIDNPSVKVCINKTENRITFRIKNGYSLELLTSETRKLFGSTENKTTKYKNCENIPHLKIIEVVLVLCNIVNNDYQQDSKVLHTFGSLLEISPTNHIFSKIFNSEFQDIEVWFTDQNSQPLEIEDRLNLTLVIRWSIYYKSEIFNWT